MQSKIPYQDDIEDNELDFEHIYALVEGEYIPEQEKMSAASELDSLSPEGDQGDGEKSGKTGSGQDTREPHFKAFADDIENEPPLFTSGFQSDGKVAEKKAHVRVEELRALVHGDAPNHRVEPNNTEMAACEAALPSGAVDAFEISEGDIPEVDMAEPSLVAEALAPEVAIPKIRADDVLLSEKQAPRADKQERNNLAAAANCGNENSNTENGQTASKPCTFPDCPYVALIQAELERQGQSAIFAKLFGK